MLLALNRLLLVQLLCELFNFLHALVLLSLSSVGFLLKSLDELARRRELGGHLLLLRQNVLSVAFKNGQLSLSFKSELGHSSFHSSILLHKLLFTAIL